MSPFHIYSHFDIHMSMGVCILLRLNNCFNVSLPCILQIGSQTGGQSDCVPWKQERLDVFLYHKVISLSSTHLMVASHLMCKKNFFYRRNHMACEKNSILICLHTLYTKKTDDIHIDGTLHLTS